MTVLMSRMTPAWAAALCALAIAPPIVAEPAAPPAPGAPSEASYAPAPTPEALAAMRATVEGLGLQVVQANRAGFGPFLTFCSQPVYRADGDLMTPEACDFFETTEFATDTSGTQTSQFRAARGLVTVRGEFRLVEGALCSAREDLEITFAPDEPAPTGLSPAAMDQAIAASVANLFGTEAGFCDLLGREPGTGALRLITFRWSGERPPETGLDDHIVLMQGRPARLTE